ncbi:YggS family pyridoxal phosphate-dependent enzyme [soil metagenome]
MSFMKEKYEKIMQELALKNVTLIAVSKTKPVEDIMEAYQAGQRDFGENYVQELLEKYETLPKDIRWHFIGHLQSNKVKYIAPFVHLIHGVDSEKLLTEINKQGKKLNIIVPCLLQMHISAEETKFGLDEGELESVVEKIKADPKAFEFAAVKGFMGMASFTEDNHLIIQEFNILKNLFEKTKNQLSIVHYPLSILSMGMSADYRLAIEAGTTMVRIGSMLFGSRIYNSN